MHAALAEPVRLAIVDRLAICDLAPGELSSALGMPTNLMAHHLRVLESAGIVRRVRSEGDARRAYVQLRLDDRDVMAMVGAGADPSGITATPVPRVVFVCSHNSARSQLACWVWRQVSAVPAASAGTHPARAVHHRAIATARRHHLDPGVSRTSHVRDVLTPGDLVVAVCDNAHEELAAARTASGSAPSSWLHWAVPDPARTDTDEAFEAAYVSVSHRVDRLAVALDPN